MENCVKITQEPAPANQINIFTKTGTLTLNALNEIDLKHWVQALQNVAFKDRSATLARNSMMEEDNDLYCTSYSDGLFPVKLLASDIPNTKCNLEAKSYILHLTTTEIQLKPVDDHATVVARWPYRYVRKYGYRDGKFTFEAGRKCDTGEGVFSWHHSNPQEVFRCMAAKMKSMKKLINGESVASLDCGEHQLNAALSMEPGSRSPLPPSPNHHANQSDIDQSAHLIRGFLSSSDSLNNVSMSSTSSLTPLQPPIKHVPNKPPRKSLPTIESGEKSSRIDVQIKSTPSSTKFSKYQDYEPVALAQTGAPPPKPSTIILKTPPPIPGNKPTISSINSPSTDQPPELPVRNESMNLDDRNYERIENISNAWKTLGVSDIKHTEHNDSDDDLIDFAWQRSQSQKDDSKHSQKSPLNAYCDADDASKNGDDSNYDKLEFFATKKAPSNDYRTIVTISGRKSSTQIEPTNNDYEIIGECGTATLPDHKPYRLADDSYMGYGVLRKPAITSTTAHIQHQQQPQMNSSTTGNGDDQLNHRKFNGLDYAIVSKPKHV